MCVCVCVCVAVQRVMLKVTAQEYRPHLGSQLCLHFIVTGYAGDQSVTAIKVVDLLTPGLTVTVKHTQTHQGSNDVISMQSNVTDSRMYSIYTYIYDHMSQTFTFTFN